MPNKKVLITGAAGFIGSALSLDLLQHGWDVYGVDNFNDYYSVDLKRARVRNVAEKSALAPEWFGVFRCVEADCLDADSFADHFPMHDVDLVIHLAAQPGVAASVQDPHPYLRNNITAFCSVLEMMRALGKPLLMASSSTVYGEMVDDAVMTARIDAPRSVYGATKSSNEILAQAYCRNYGMSVTAMRFFSIYGPWGRPDMFYYIIAQKLLHGETITVYGDGSIIRDMTYIDDAVQSVRMLMERKELSNPGYAAFDVGFRNQISVRKMIETIAMHLGMEPNIHFEQGRDYDMRTTKARNQYDECLKNIDPIQPDEGLKQFIKWIAGEGAQFQP